MHKSSDTTDRDATMPANYTALNMPGLALRPSLAIARDGRAAQCVQVRRTQQLSLRPQAKLSKQVENTASL